MTRAETPQLNLGGHQGQEAEPNLKKVNGEATENQIEEG